MGKVKFEYFTTKTNFTTTKVGSEFDDSIVFIEDTKEIFTHGNYWGIPNLNQNYDSSTQKLQLRSGTTVLSELDATPFIKDGMLDSVSIVSEAEQGVSVQTPYLKFVFNTQKSTASGSDSATHETIRVSISDFITAYNGANVLLTSNYTVPNSYTAPAANDSMDTAIGKVVKGINDINTNLEWIEHTVVNND